VDTGVSRGQRNGYQPDDTFCTDKLVDWIFLRSYFFSSKIKSISLQENLHTTGGNKQMGPIVPLQNNVGYQ
jgi:hypothetical protein